MRRLWPLRLGRSGLFFVMVSMRPVTSFLESARMTPEWCLHEKRWADWWSGFIRKCALIANLGSVGEAGFCGAQWVSSPFRDDFVMGRVKRMTGSPWWLVVRVSPECEMCLVVLYLEMAGTVNSSR